MVNDGEIGLHSRFRVHMETIYGRIYVGDGIVSPNSNGLRYEMVLECGFGEIFGMMTAHLKTCSQTWRACLRIFPKTCLH